MRTYAVGDIHGCLGLLNKIIKAIEADAMTASEPGTIVFLGDYIDRGHNSKGVIDRLIAGNFLHGWHKVFLKGNHEDMLLASGEDASNAEMWLINGGRATVQSYDAVPHGFSAPVVHAFFQKFPQEHLDWMTGLALTHRADDHLFVHAGVDPTRSMNDQHADVLLWIREPFLSYRGPWSDSVRVVVHGHTPSRTIQAQPNRIGIDTGAFHTGVLSAVVVEAGQEPRFIQVR